MNGPLRVLLVDPATGFYRLRRYRLGEYFGPVDLGLHIADRYRSLNIGAGILAGSIIPGCNRLVITGFSPAWRGFFISSMGSGALVFDNLGINMVSLVGRAPVPSVLCLNRLHGEEIEVEVVPVDLAAAWARGRGGVYGLMEEVLERFGGPYETDPRILAVGPAALATDFGAIGSAPISRGRIDTADTWAGRGGMGSAMLQQHGIAAVIYGGTFVDEDFRDRKVADEWFEAKYQQRLLAKDFEATAKYRFDPKFETGGTFGVNFASIRGRLLAFNYRSIYETEAARLALHQEFVVDHYLRQFNEETIRTRQQSTCGEPCSAVCKKKRGEYKKDYEPYQTLGPLCGIFDERAAEKLNAKSDAAGFDGIAVGGVLSWLMECLDRGDLAKEDLGVTRLPRWKREGFDVVADSLHNAELGVELIDSILGKRAKLDLSEGPRKWARSMRRHTGGARLLDTFVHVSNGRRGWMVPNQYWTPGVLSPMAIMGKYYMFYGPEFFTPRNLGRVCADRMKAELMLDNLGMCRFHRGWAEEMLPEIVDKLFGLKEAFLNSIEVLASRINSRNANGYWEASRNLDFVQAFLVRRRDVDGDQRPELQGWIEAFEKDRNEAGLSFWYEMRKGIDESLRAFL